MTTSLRAIRAAGERWKAHVLLSIRSAAVFDSASPARPAATDERLALITVAPAHVPFLLLVGRLTVPKATLLVRLIVVVVVVIVRVAVVDRKDNLVARLLAARQTGVARGRHVVSWRASGREVGLREARSGGFEVVLRVTAGMRLGQLVVLGIGFFLVL